jgi:hypothetical protein
VAAVEVTRASPDPATLVEPDAQAHATETGGIADIFKNGKLSDSELFRNSEPEPEPIQADEDTESAKREAPTPDNLYQFPVKSKRGRPRKTGDDYRVSVEQVSKHTYAVRLRWKRADGVEDGIVVNRLRDDIVKEIQRSKKHYEQFKAQTIASWKSRAVRQSHGA